MDKIVKNKRDLELVTVQLLFSLQNKFRKIHLTCYLTKFNDVTYSDFWVISKITSANLCMPDNDIIYYSTFDSPFESEKCEKQKKKLQKLEYLIIVFEGPSFGKK